MSNKITLEMVDAEIVDESFYVFPRTTMTACALTLRNGYTVLGQSACVDPNDFDAKVGRAAARDDAKAKVWGLLAFRQREFLTERESGR